MGTEWARILLVEDHDDTRRVTERYLARSGFYVRSAETKAEALALLLDDRFDILLAGLELADGSGLDLMRQVALEHPATRGIALTGWGRPSDIDDAMSAGFSMHLLKPVDLSTIISAIERLLESPQFTAAI
jgi:DNA-binding NtrC family response regulator